MVATFQKLHSKLLQDACVRCGVKSLSNGQLRCPRSTPSFQAGASEAVLTSLGSAQL